MISGQGRIAGLQRSAGGVPKLPVEHAAVGPAGMEGDKQCDRRFHGGPHRALCLYSQERIDALSAEGHDVSAGALGENVTIAGLSWEVVRPGVRLRLGCVEVEVTGFASPCSKLAGAFLDARFTRVGQKVNPGWSRVYVRVLGEGALTVGDPVVLLP
jgi:MOSC domain-containing protein YiiM